MSHEFCKRRCRTLPLRLLHDLECFSRVTKRHRGQEMMVCVIRLLKWRFCPQSRLIFAFLYPMAVFHHIVAVPRASSDGSFADGARGQPDLHHGVCAWRHAAAAGQGGASAIARNRRGLRPHWHHVYETGAAPAAGEASVPL